MVRIYLSTSGSSCDLRGGLVDSSDGRSICVIIFKVELRSRGQRDEDRGSVSKTAASRTTSRVCPVLFALLLDHRLSPSLSLRLIHQWKDEKLFGLMFSAVTSRRRSSTPDVQINWFVLWILFTLLPAIIHSSLNLLPILML